MATGCAPYGIALTPTAKCATTSQHKPWRPWAAEAARKPLSGGKQTPKGTTPKAAEHYNPLAMSPELVKAHKKLDREVDKAFGARRRLTTERQHQETLFSSYVYLSQNKVVP